MLSKEMNTVCRTTRHHIIFIDKAANELFTFDSIGLWDARRRSKTDALRVLFHIHLVLSPLNTQQRCNSRSQRVTHRVQFVGRRFLKGLLQHTVDLLALDVAVGDHAHSLLLSQQGRSIPHEWIHSRPLVVVHRHQSGHHWYCWYHDRQPQWLSFDGLERWRAEDCGWWRPTWWPSGRRWTWWRECRPCECP